MRKNFEQEFGEKFLEMIEAQEPMRWIPMTFTATEPEIVLGAHSIGKTMTIIVPKDREFGLEMTQETLLSRFELAEILDEE